MFVPESWSTRTEFTNQISGQPYSQWSSCYKTSEACGSTTEPTTTSPVSETRKTPSGYTGETTPSQRKVCVAASLIWLSSCWLFYPNSSGLTGTTKIKLLSGGAVHCSQWPVSGWRNCQNKALLPFTLYWHNTFGRCSCHFGVVSEYIYTLGVELLHLTESCFLSVNRLRKATVPNRYGYIWGEWSIPCHHIHPVGSWPVASMSMSG